MHDYLYITSLCTLHGSWTAQLLCWRSSNPSRKWLIRPQHQQWKAAAQSELLVVSNGWRNDEWFRRTHVCIMNPHQALLLRHTDISCCIMHQMVIQCGINPMPSMIYSMSSDTAFGSKTCWSATHWLQVSRVRCDWNGSFLLGMSRYSEGGQTNTLIYANDINRTTTCNKPTSSQKLHI